MEVQLLAYAAKPVVYIKSENPKIGRFRNGFIKLTNSALFDKFIMACILLNTIVLAVVWYDQPKALDVVLTYLNTVFMLIFTIEAVIKLIAMRAAYFKDGWNIFDFTVVVFTIIALVLAKIPGLDIDLSSQATMIRILRILRALRIVKRWQKLKIISETIMESLPALGSLGALLLLLIFLFAVIGVNIFSFVALKDALSYHVNF